MGNLLIEESPLIVLPSLAEKIGLNNAIFIQQAFWFLKTGSGARRGGKRWLYNSYHEWTDFFPFWSERTIRRITNDLERLGLILAEVENNNTKFYRIPDDIQQRLLALADAPTTEDREKPQEENGVFKGGQSGQGGGQSGQPPSIYSKEYTEKILPKGRTAAEPPDSQEEFSLKGKGVKPKSPKKKSDIPYRDIFILISRYFPDWKKYPSSSPESKDLTKSIAICWRKFFHSGIGSLETYFKDFTSSDYLMGRGGHRGVAKNPSSIFRIERIEKTMQGVYQNGKMDFAKESSNNLEVILANDQTKHHINTKETRPDGEPRYAHLGEDLETGMPKYYDYGRE